MRADAVGPTARQLRVKPVAQPASSFRSACSPLPTGTKGGKRHTHFIKSQLYGQQMSQLYVSTMFHKEARVTLESLKEFLFAARNQPNVGPADGYPRCVPTLNSRKEKEEVKDVLQIVSPLVASLFWSNNQPCCHAKRQLAMLRMDV
uniref:Uncharacterized protein n=1 Tax=Trichuris muris TaxID=70415 RepID=A0A5S6QMR2_TRIMR